jgi:predicted HD phosphohydrolase
MAQSGREMVARRGEWRDLANVPINRAGFHTMAESTWDDWQKIVVADKRYQASIANRVLGQLKAYDGDFGGMAVDRLEHSLQSATRAFRDGMDEEYVVCALLHDIGESLSPFHHAEMGALLLKPYVTKENHWMLKHHSIFQGYYFFHHLGSDRNKRDEFRGHPCFEKTAMFCARHDQNCFDPNYDTMPFDAFIPLVRRVLAQPKRPRFKTVVVER